VAKYKNQNFDYIIIQKKKKKKKVPKGKDEAIGGCGWVGGR
jgi:hypothetical protein